MDSLTCKNCRGNSSVPPSAQHIRCHGCKTLFSTGSPSDGDWTQGRSPITMGQTPNEDDLTYQSRSPRCRRRAAFGLELKNKKGEVKDFYESFRRKFSVNNHQPSQTWSPPKASSDSPPRGKRALICGVSYKKQKCELKGTERDVVNMRHLLVEEYSFPEESIRTLAEDGSSIPPTKKNIEDAFQWLVRGIQAGDSLVFYFSGHGKRLRDLVGDEVDGFDETICPMDFETNGMILDNDINDAIVRPLPNGVILHAIVDSCHSGTILDLPHVYNIATGNWDDNRPPSGAYKGTSGGKAICFSACEDYQLAADSSAFSADKEMTGAMTTTFIQAIRNRKDKLTYQDILNYMHQTLKRAHTSGRLSASIRRIFHRRILQDPQLSASEEFSTSKEFKL